MIEAVASRWDNVVGTALKAYATEFPAEAARANRTLDSVLHALRSEAEPGWSLLAPGGSPIEFVWRPCDPGVFWTAEVAGPSVAERPRLGLALSILRTLSWSIPHSSWVDRASELQSDGSRLEWGTWLGGRHRPAGDDGKLYVEIPAGVARDRSTLPLALRAQWPEDGELRLIGLAGGLVETYWRVSAAEPHILYRAAAAVGCQDRLPDLAALFGLLRGRCPQKAFVGSKLGLSLTFDSQGIAQGLGVFIGADRVGGAAIATRLREAGWREGPLSQLWQAGKLRAGSVGCGLSRHGISLQIGFAPT